MQLSHVVYLQLTICKLCQAAASLCGRAELWQIHWPVGVPLLLVPPLLFFLNLLWFSKIVRGGVKLFFGEKPKKVSTFSPWRLYYTYAVRHEDFWVGNDAQKGSEHEAVRTHYSPGSAIRLFAAHKGSSERTIKLELLGKSICLNFVIVGSCLQGTGQASKTE